jgi:hypothetical protein
MTRKHYKAIADAICKCTSADGTSIRKAEFVALLSAELYKDNSNFDKGKFYDACNKGGTE